jgi:hypothetical protein
MAYQGFAKVQKSVEKGGKSSAQAGAIAAAIGRRKYGAKRFAQMAAEGKKRSAKSTGR